MTYDEIIDLINYRLQKGIKPYLTEEEAMDYLGPENVKIIDMLSDFCIKYDYTIFAHETGVKSAESIIKKGFVTESDEIDKKTFENKNGKKLKVSGRADDGLRYCLCDDIDDKPRTPKNSSIINPRCELRSLQHFFIQNSKDILVLFMQWLIGAILEPNALL